MIRKLRIKVIGIIMAMAAVLLMVVFSSMYVAAAQNYRRRSEEAIRTALMSEVPDGKERPGYAEKGGAGAQPPEADEKGGAEAQPPEADEKGGAEAQPPETPELTDNAILVLKLEADGTIREIRNTTVHQIDTEYESLISEAEAHGSDRGELKNEKLRYQYRKNDENGTVCYVFADMHEEMRALSEQIVHSVCIGAVAMVFFFLSAVWFSGWAVRPVEEAIKREKQFVADASHELKTPLTVILANAEMVLRDINVAKNANIAKSDDISEKRKCNECLNNDIKRIANPDKNAERMMFIKEEAGRMKNLTESLLSLAKSDAGTAALERTDISLSEIAEFQAASFETVLFETGKTLRTEIEENVRIQGDEKKLRQLFGILLDNAGKYGLKNSEVKFILKRNGEKGAYMCVENESEKLNQDICRHLFDRFYRADESRGKVPGYGLGLSIADSIVKEHGGTIKAAYENGRMKMIVEI